MTENMNDKNKAFTLAETLIVLAVLGIVAAITIPPVVRQHMEAMGRTKIKKSMSVYDLAIQKMTVENDLKSDTELINWSNEVENCGNTVPYFKAQNRNGCTFKTSDGVWWNISDIMNPIIALSEQALNDAISNGIDGVKSFKLVASFDRASGAFRVDDLNYEKLKFQAQLALANEETKQDVEDNVDELEKLYGFINNNKKSKDNAGEEVCEVTKSCEDNTCSDTDCHGRITVTYHDCGFSGICDVSSKYTYDDNGNIITRLACDGSGNNCSELAKFEYDRNNNLAAEYYCDKNGNNCNYSIKYIYDGDNNITAYYEDCDGNGIRCEFCDGSACPPVNSHGYYDPEDTVYDD